MLELPPLYLVEGQMSIDQANSQVLANLLTMR